MENDFILEEAWPFTAQDLTEMVNQVDNVWGYYGDLDYSPAEEVSSTIVEVATDGNEVRVLPAVERGGPETKAYERKEGSEYFKIPSFPVIRTITPSDIQDWVAKANRQRNPKTLEESVSERLQDQRYSHDLTLEYLRVCSHRGILMDGNGSQLLNIFQAFDVPKRQINFELNNPGTNVAEKISELHAATRHNLLGETMSDIEITCGRDFFNAFVGHPSVEKFWLNYQKALELLPAPEVVYGRVFRHPSGITLREYDAPVTLHNDQTVDMIPGGIGQAFPVGTRSASRTYFGPPDNINYANVGGEEIFITQEYLKHGKGVEIRSESCPLSVWRRPALLTEILPE